MNKWAIRLISAVFVTFGVLAGEGYAQTSGELNPSPVEKPELKDLLEKGLKARRPVEFQFIARVLQLVDSGALPKNMVRTTFLWARDKKRPFQSFEFALRKQAQEKLGLTL